MSSLYREPISSKIIFLMSRRNNNETINFQHYKVHYLLIDTRDSTCFFLLVMMYIS